MAEGVSDATREPHSVPPEGGNQKKLGWPNPLAAACYVSRSRSQHLPGLQGPLGESV